MNIILGHNDLQSQPPSTQQIKEKKRKKISFNFVNQNFDPEEKKIKTLIKKNIQI